LIRFTMRTALIYLVVATLCLPAYSADRKSWNRIRYVGGTIPMKASPYDWNTNLTISLQPPALVIEIAPASVFVPRRTVRIAPDRITSFSEGSAAWRHVAAVPGAVLPAKSPALFGLLQESGYIGIVFQDEGKPASILLDTLLGWQILPLLKQLTGKPIEDSE
jgi:hypothetical protein